MKLFPNHGRSFVSVWLVEAPNGYAYLSGAVVVNYRRLEVRLK